MPPFGRKNKFFFRLENASNLTCIFVKLACKNCHTETQVSNFMYFRAEMVPLFFLEKDTPRRKVLICNYIVNTFTKIQKILC